MENKNIKELLKDQSFVSNLLPKSVIIEKFLSEGGQGIVYKGSIQDQKVAIKIYFPGQVQKRIEREIDALRKINNPHIVKLHWSDSINFKGEILEIVATSFIPGEDLLMKIKNKPLTQEEVGVLIFDLSEAIKALWDERIVHRDITPRNIIIQPDKRACLIDLGIARHIEQTPLTATGYTWGTLGYMSPEQYSASKQLTYKSDLFSLGVVVIECGLGRHPTNRNQNQLISIGIHNYLPTEISNWRFADLLKRMLNPEAVKRPRISDIQSELISYS